MYKLIAVIVYCFAISNAVAHENTAVAAAVSKAGKTIPKRFITDRYCQGRNVSSDYDSLYRAAVHKYYPPRFNDALEWCYIKSQSIAESGQDPNAISPVGAMGVLQLMPATFNEVAMRYGYNQDAYDARTNIMLGVAYMSILFKIWHVDRAKKCHREVTQASYNAGAGNIIKAQIKARGAPCWDAIGLKLSEVTGKHARETRGYISKISKTHERLTQ